MRTPPSEADPLIRIAPGWLQAAPDERTAHRLGRNPARRRTGAASWLRIAAIAIAVGNCHAIETPRVTAYGWEDSTSDGQKNKRGERWHHGKTTEAEFRRWLSTRLPSASLDACESWSDHDRRVAVFHPVEGAAVLIVGGSYGGERGGNNVGVKDIERHFFAESFGRGGAPLEGQLTIRIQPERWPDEQRCLEKLRGVRTKWTHIEMGSIDAERTVEMKVTDVQFARAAKVGSNGETIPTGEAMATVTMSESWMSMAFREMRAQRWGIAGGIAGSACLMMLIWGGGRIWRHLRRREGRAQSREDHCQNQNGKESEEAAPAIRAHGAPEQIEHEGRRERETETGGSRRGPQRRRSWSRKSGPHRSGKRKRRRR